MQPEPLPLVATRNILVPGGRMPRGQYTPQGERVPAGIYSEEELAEMQAAGLLEPYVEPEVAEPEVSEPSRPIGQWTLDPEQLAGLELEVLQELVLEIDADFELGDLDEAQLRLQLSSDFVPQNAPSGEGSNDRTEIEGGDLAEARRLADGGR